MDCWLVHASFLEPTFLTETAGSNSNGYCFGSSFQADLPEIFRLYAQPDLDDGKVLSLSEAERIFERLTRYPDYTIYVAVCNDQIVGTFALLIMDNLGHLGTPSAVIDDVAVDPAWQRRGVGNMMIHNALEAAHEKVAIRPCFPRT